MSGLGPSRTGSRICTPPAPAHSLRARTPPNFLNFLGRWQPHTPRKRRLRARRRSPRISRAAVAGAGNARWVRDRTKPPRRRAPFPILLFQIPRLSCCWTARADGGRRPSPSLFRKGPSPAEFTVLCLLWLLSCLLSWFLSRSYARQVDGDRRLMWF